MKVLSKYKCEFCNTEYVFEKEALNCEKSHKIKGKIKSRMYIPVSMDESGYPITISVEFEDGAIVKYKR